MENKTSEAQIRASKKYNKANREYLRIRDYRSKGIKFLKEFSTIEDLLEFEKIINDRKIIIGEKE